MLSARDRQILAQYVTHPEAPIYAILSTVPPEVFGAFGSYFSRDPEDFRQHILKAIKGELRGHKRRISDEYLEIRANREAYIMEAVQLAARVDPEVADSALQALPPPVSAIESGLEKAQQTFRTWYGKYGHKSTGNMVHIPFIGTKVSQLWVRTLVNDQLAFFVEQSTRYCNFKDMDFHRDHDVMRSPVRKVYVDTLTEMVRCYSEFTEHAVQFYKEMFPYDVWASTQHADTQPTKRTYNREIHGRAFDLSRALLPQAIRTNVAWILDARSVEWDIAAWKGHPLHEVRRNSLLLEEAAGIIAPSLLKYTEENSFYANKYDISALTIPIETSKIEKGVRILSAQSNTLDILLGAMARRRTRGSTLEQCIQYFSERSTREKIDILQTLVLERGPHDEWVDIEEEADVPKIVYELTTDVGALRDLIRHQKSDRAVGIYTLDNGYSVPPDVYHLSASAQSLYHEAIERAHTAEVEIREYFTHQAQYVLPMATLHTLTFSQGINQLQYMIKTRSTPEGNDSYRIDTFNVAEAVCRVFPWMLGLEEYPKDTSLQKVYEEHAPMKNFLKLDFRKTNFHT